jgi:hypothetical protein
MLPWIVVGNVENRRVTSFLDALASMDQPVLGVLSWAELLRDPDVLLRLPAEPALLRLESAGENEEVQHALYVLGGGDPLRRAAYGELLAPDLHHRGWQQLLGVVERTLQQRPLWRPLATPSAIEHVFDKVAFHASCRGLGVRVAPAVAATDLDSLQHEMERMGVRSVFLKQRTGSSASGIAIYRSHPRPRVITTMLGQQERWFNSRRLQHLTDPGRIRHLVEQLFAWGVHLEAEVPKAMQGQAFLDLRVVMIAHEPAFAVVRCSEHPITNLHLGGQRGDLQELEARCPPEVWERAMEDCRRVSRAYGGLHLGLDLLLERDLQNHCVIEANAFGDLLPNLQNRAGRTVYQAEIAAANLHCTTGGQVRAPSSS